MREPAERGALTQALRRSWLTILLCVIGGMAITGVLHVTRQARYQAVSQVFIAEQDLNQLVLGVAVTTDPSRAIANDLQLASSINYEQAVAGALGRPGYGYRDVQSQLDVTNDGTDDILKFTATGASGAAAVTLANVAVNTYDSYRAGVLSQPILSSLRSGGQTVSDTQRLGLLQRLNRNAVIISRAQTATPQATLTRDLAIGLIAGLIVGLLLMALREAVPRLSPVAQPPPPSDPARPEPSGSADQVDGIPRSTSSGSSTDRNPSRRLVRDLSTPIQTTPSARRSEAAGTDGPRRSPPAPGSSADDPPTRSSR